MAKKCPRCGSENIMYHREQTGNIGAGTNKVVIQPAKKSKGCLYWLLIGWWWKLLFGGGTRSGLNFSANKSLNRTVGICQNCSHTWKV